MLDKGPFGLSGIICLQGFTALHIAVEQGNRAPIELLLRHGADALRPANDVSLLLTTVQDMPPAQHAIYVQQEAQLHDWDHIQSQTFIHHACCSMSEHKHDHGEKHAVCDYAGEDSFTFCQSKKKSRTGQAADWDLAQKGWSAPATV